MHHLLEKLKGPESHRKDNVDNVVESVAAEQVKFDAVFQGIWSIDPVIRSRSADVIEKIAQLYPSLIQSHKGEVLTHLHEFEQKEMRWHMTRILPYLELHTSELGPVFHHLMTWLQFDSNQKVKVSSLEALAKLSIRNNYQREEVSDLLRNKSKFSNGSLRTCATELYDSMFRDLLKEDK